MAAVVCVQVASLAPIGILLLEDADFFNIPIGILLLKNADYLNIDSRDFFSGVRIRRRCGLFFYRKCRENFERGLQKSIEYGIIK